MGSFIESLRRPPAAALLIQAADKKGAAKRRKRRGGIDARTRSTGFLLAAPLLPGSTTEADLLGQHPALLGVVGRDHRIIGRQAPALAVFGGRQAVIGH